MHPLSVGWQATIANALTANWLTHVPQDLQDVEAKRISPPCKHGLYERRGYVRLQGGVEKWQVTSQMIRSPCKLYSGLRP